MQTLKFLLLIIIWIPNDLIAQIEYDCYTTLEIETGESLFSDQTIFGDGDSKKYRNRIISQEYKKNSYLVLIGVKSFEKGKPFCNPVINGDTLKIEFRVKGEVDVDGIESVEIGQSKYREVQIRLNNIPQAPKVVLFNEKEINESKEKFLTFPVSYELLNGDTINRLDKYGQKQGKWIEGTEYDKIESCFNESKLEKATIYDYRPNGQLRSEYYYTPNCEEGQVYFISYFETGIIQEENYSIKDYGKFKTKWYSNGNIYQENIYNGEKIEITQYKENGQIDCKCETTAGAESFKGMIICWTTNEFEIPCTFYNDKGEVIANNKKTFKLNYEINPRR